ncbi:uncharacterized protein LOC110609545 [Manihot esculenta]|uniref:Uncharacterized protein n=1 Tax=Manihot esculenta TaxID=3983 RepID=A0A2C9WF12_MANES|nr:uncharacterized protein LOC110609545 [Manihot esculenta]OAY58339.1 hypothetical protein MANES_02G169100v8 [Manihot esculenta]
MGCKRRSTGSSGRVDVDDDEVHDLGNDVRLARRWKRRVVAYQDSKLNHGRKISSGEGNCNKGSKKLPETSYILISDDDDAMDVDYAAYFNSIALEPNGNSHVDKRRPEDDGDTGSGALAENMSLTVVDALDNDADPQNRMVLESNNVEIDDSKEGEYLDSDYMKYLDCIALEPFVDNSVVYIDNIVDNCVNTNAVNGLVENGTSGDKWIEKESINGDASNHDNNACGDLDLQHKEITENNNVEFDDDVDYKKFLVSELFGGGGNDQHVANVANDINFDNHSAEVDPCGNQSVENGTTDCGFVEPRAADNNADYNDALDDIDPEYKMFLGNLREDGKSYVVEVPLNDDVSVIIKYEMDDGSHNGCGVENLSKTRPCQEAAGGTKHDHKPEMESDMDESYKIFLNCLKREGGNMVFVHESGARVIYEEDEESSSDSEVIVMDTDPFANANYTPFVLSKQHIVTDVDAIEDVKDSSRNQCIWFMESVMGILKKPYDPEEYDKLLEEVYSRKPVIEDREMRNGRTRLCPAQRMGKSYVDLHQDLDKQIKSAGSNKPKILNLLRGFFYWLQHTPHEGIFKPWMDSSCLEVLPHGNVASDSY